MSGKVISIREARRQRYENRPDLMVDVCLNDPARLARIKARRLEDLKKAQEEAQKVAHDMAVAQRMNEWSIKAVLLLACTTVAAVMALVILL